MTNRPAPAVLAEDLRALAEVVPFDPATIAMLEAAADHLDEIDQICRSTLRRGDRIAVCDLPPGHADDVHQQSGGITWPVTVGT